MKLPGSEKIWNLTRFSRPLQKLVEAKPLLIRADYGQMSCLSVALGAPGTPRFRDRVFSDAATFVSLMLLPPCNYDPIRHPYKFRRTSDNDLGKRMTGNIWKTINIKIGL